MTNATIEETPLELLTSQITDVLRGYVTALLWANASCNVEDCEDGRETGECEHSRDAQDRFELENFSSFDANAMRCDVEAFVLDNLADFREYLEEREYNESDGSVAEHFGHDFALTRNGHGAGFWDRGLDELGDRLTTASKVYGEAMVYVSVDSVSL